MPIAAWWHGLCARPSAGYGRRVLRLLPFLPALLLLSCSKDAAAPAGNEQAVIDKADADVRAAQDATAGTAVAPPPARTAGPA
jgi:hypothetical protein